LSYNCNGGDRNTNERGEEVRKGKLCATAGSAEIIPNRSACAKNT